MATDKKTISRLKILDELLTTDIYTRRALLTLLNERLRQAGYEEVGDRTLRKDLTLMQGEPFNVVFEEDRREGKEKLWHILPGHSLYVTKLSREEQNLMHEVLHTLGKFSGIPSFEWLDRLSEWLGVSSENDYKIMDFGSTSVQSNLLGKLFNFIANKRVVELYYRTFKDPEEKHILFWPYRLKQYNGRWFVIGKAEDNFWLNFPLNNIYRVEDAGKDYPSYPLTLERRFDQVVGVTIPADKKPENIICWVDDRGFPYLISKPIHSSMEEITDVEVIEGLRKKFPEYEGGHFVTMSLIVNTELKQVLCSYMDEVVVLEPLELRMSMREIAAKISRRYGE